MHVCVYTHSHSKNEQVKTAQNAAVCEKQVYLSFRLTGMSPFLGDDDTETITNIASGEFEYPDPDPEEGYEDITLLAKDFIDNLLKLKPK